MSRKRAGGVFFPFNNWGDVGNRVFFTVDVVNDTFYFAGLTKADFIMSYNNESSARNFGWGLFWLAAGIIGTLASSGHILFYGAIAVGAIRLIIGLLQAL